MAVQRRSEGPGAVMVINQHAIGRVDADALHAEHVAGIRVTGIGQQLGGGEDIRHILGARRQRDRPADRRRVIAVADAEVEVGAGAEAAVRGGDAQAEAADLGSKLSQPGSGLPSARLAL
ncbi:hypothetical protein D3C84_773870 [compost metagenome]